tara:strand:+ start:2955 stop:3197 length:243 start_codon:yes stop_codon:yes gene_type:complete
LPTWEPFEQLHQYPFRGPSKKSFPEKYHGRSNEAISPALITKAYAADGIVVDVDQQRIVVFRERSVMQPLQQEMLIKKSH